MPLWGCFVAVLAYWPALKAQEIDSSRSEIESFDEVLVSVNRLGGSRRNAVGQIESIDAKKIAAVQAPTTADLLAQTGQVFVQKSQVGGGSPVLRGFEASRVLLVLDGIRINNATFRAGHLQDLITIDPHSLEGVELYMGSGSTLYGSDALGGVVYMKTKAVPYREQTRLGGSVNSRYASAFGSMVNSVGLQASGSRWSWMGQYTQSQFGDLKTGSTRSYTDVEGFGLRPWYVSRINGVDSMLPNAQPAKLLGSGYSQRDALSKWSYGFGKHKLTALASVSRSSAVPRFDRLSQFSWGPLDQVIPKFAEWNYQPQNRSLWALSLRTFANESDASADRGVVQSLSLARQAFEVGRYSRRFGQDWGQTQLDQLQQYTLNWDRQARWNGLGIQFGAEAVYNDLQSTAFETEVSTSEVRASRDTRYADSFAYTGSAALYMQFQAHLGGHTRIQGGTRLTHYQAHAQFTDNNIWGLDYGVAKVNTTAPVFNLGLNQSIHTNWQFKLSWNTAFRNPNLDDLTKLFESNPGEKYIMPNTRLRSEFSETLDAGIQGIQVGRWQLEAGAYRTRIKGLLIDQPAPLDYQLPVAVMYRGLLTPVYVMSNASGGWVRGAYASGKTLVFSREKGRVKSLSLEARVAWTKGRYRNSENRYEPLDHIPPIYGLVGVKSQTKWGQIEYYALFQGQKRAEDYSNSGEDNLSATPSGQFNPAWWTHNLRWTSALGEHWNAVVNAENLADLQYRTFASGVSAPGRSVSIALQFQF